MSNLWYITLEKPICCNCKNEVDKSDKSLYKEMQVGIIKDIFLVCPNCNSIRFHTFITNSPNCKRELTKERLCIDISGMEYR